MLILCPMVSDFDKLWTNIGCSLFYNTIYSGFVQFYAEVISSILDTKTSRGREPSAAPITP